MSVKTVFEFISEAVFVVKFVVKKFLKVVKKYEKSQKGVKNKNAASLEVTRVYGILLKFTKLYNLLPLAPNKSDLYNFV